MSKIFVLSTPVDTLSRMLFSRRSETTMSQSATRNPHSPILPGATIGVLGSGQLGRMFAIAARELGYRIHIYSPDNDSPAGQIGDVEFTARYDNLEKLREFARGVR